MAYVIERDSRSGKRYVGVYRAADGKYKSAGTYDSHERAYGVAEEEERHARGFLDETSPADKAKMTIWDFCEQRFLRYYAVSPNTRQQYGYAVKNHIVPYIGHLRISEVNRETFFNLLVKVLPAEEASHSRCLRPRRASLKNSSRSAGSLSRSRVTTMTGITISFLCARDRGLWRTGLLVPALAGRGHLGTIEMPAPRWSVRRDGQLAGWVVKASWIAAATERRL